MRLSPRRSAVALVVLVAGCGAGTTARVAQKEPTCFRAAGHQEVAGELADIPARLPRRPPLLLVFHGLHESASYVSGETAFDDVAARHHFVVAYPNAVLAQRWELDHRDGDRDVAHMRAFIARVVRRLCADPRRVYATGFSNGAGFAARAGCELQDRIAAIAPVSGSYRSLDACRAGPMPTLEIHGVDPWTKTVPRLIAETKARNACRRAPATMRIAARITLTRWPGCHLERLHNRNINHEWPKLGPYNTSEVVWRFVSRYRLPSR